MGFNEYPCRIDRIFSDSTAAVPPDVGMIDTVRTYLLSAVGKRRYEHSLRTALTASRLCRRYGLDAQSGYFAGIAHDMCKDMEEDALFSLALQDGLPVSDLEVKKKSLLHGRAAAVKLQTDFGIHNADILEAVRFHTFGAAGMGNLAKILYIADKIEPGRSYSGETYVRRCMTFDLDRLLLHVTEENMRYLKAHKKTIAGETADLIKSLRGAH